MEVITSRLGVSTSPVRRLAEVGDAVLADILIRLERRFDIGLEVDEVLPDGTISVLLGLVERRAMAAQAAAMAGRVYHWDDERARRALPLYAPRPQLAVANPDTGAGIAPPPWPAHYPEPTRRIEIAVPSDAAWAEAARLYDRERTRRTLMLAAGLVCALTAVGCVIGWLRMAGRL